MSVTDAPEVEGYAYPPGSYEGPGCPTCGGCANLRSEMHRNSADRRQTCMVYFCDHVLAASRQWTPLPISTRSAACRAWKPRIRA